MSRPFVRVARVPTAQASRYLQQLCKHWSHNFEVAFDKSRGRIVFPRDARGADWPDVAIVSLAAYAVELECRIEASSADQLSAIEGAVARHLDRFAFREAPLAFVWREEVPNAAPATPEQSRRQPVG